jgi:hypothetical protein
LPPGIDVDRLAAVSVYLRKHGEMAFYGAEDLIPTTAYDQDEASRAFTGAEEATQALVLVLAAAGG